MLEVDRIADTEGEAISENDHRGVKSPDRRLVGEKIDERRQEDQRPPDQQRGEKLGGQCGGDDGRQRQQQQHRGCVLIGRALVIGRPEEQDRGKPPAEHDHGVVEDDPSHHQPRPGGDQPVELAHQDEEDDHRDRGGDDLHGEQHQGFQLAEAGSQQDQAEKDRGVEIDDDDDPAFQHRRGQQRLPDPVRVLALRDQEHAAVVHGGGVSETVFVECAHELGSPDGSGVPLSLSYRRGLILQTR